MRCSRCKLEVGVGEKDVMFVRDKLALKEAGASESECDAVLANEQATQNWQLLNLELSLDQLLVSLSLPSSMHLYVQLMTE